MVIADLIQQKVSPVGSDRQGRSRRSRVVHGNAWLGLARQRVAVRGMAGNSKLGMVLTIPFCSR